MEVKRLSKKVAAVAMLLSFAWPHSAFSAGELIANVTRILTSPSDYGGCMVRLDPPPSTVADRDCAGNFVSLDCDGNYHSKATGNNFLSAAQLALVTGYQIQIILDDTQKINEYYCTANRLDSYPY